MSTRKARHVAIIRSFEPSSQNLKVLSTQVDCEYDVVDDGTTRVLHLSTFGSDDRASERKSSQSIQLDIEQARKLVTIIERTFPNLRSNS
jgi:hypothetical protein